MRLSCRSSSNRSTTVLLSGVKDSQALSRWTPLAHFCRRNATRAILSIITAAPLLAAPNANAAENPPVKNVAPYTLTVGKAQAHFYLSADWTKPQPQITTALVIFHGKQRNAEDYFKTGMESVPPALRGKTLVIAPQFLEETDIVQHHLPATTLRWAPTAWSGGEDAIGPEAASSYDVLDRALVTLIDRDLFPNLKTVIIAGHSAGGQVVSRYVVVGTGPTDLLKAGMKVHIVIANPSSWLYFSPERPDGHGDFTMPAKTCNGKYNEWKYGIHDLPRYASALDSNLLENHFMSLDVTVLLGTADNDPNHPALDKSCAAESQGAFRLQRGENYFSYLQKRHPDTHFHLYEVNGAGHDGDAMFRSTCGQAALFGVGACNHIVH